MKRKLRKILGDLRVKWGLSRKLFRPLGHRHIPTYQLQRDIRFLQWNPGDLVNDCDGFNHVIVGLRVDWRCKHYGVRQFEFEDERWSCGCTMGVDPAVPQEQLEREMLAYIQSEAFNQYYQGDPPPYYREWREILEKGEHITDSQGVLLPQFRIQRYADRRVTAVKGLIT